MQVNKKLLKDDFKFYCWQSLTDGCVYYAIYRDVEFKIIFIEKVNKFFALPTKKYVRRKTYNNKDGNKYLTNVVKQDLKITNEMADELHKFRT